jgi:hypothetical protein
MKKIWFLFLFFISSLNASDAALLFHGNCVTCHNETKSISAPSIIEVRKHYLMAFPKKKDFVNYMSKWVLNPNAQTSIMLHAIKKYELMPQLAFQEDVLKEISAYIYETDFEKKHNFHESN